MIISFVSGKGGVGKTMIASNFAFLASKNAKTIILDLDLHNQGSTGLFIPFLENEPATFEHFVTDNSQFIDKVLKSNKVSDDLFFIPVTTNKDNNIDFSEGSSIQKYVDELVTLLDDNFDNIILDCHGGLDSISVSAFKFSDHVLLLSEADSVSFNGTLQLLSYYEKNLPPDFIKNKVKIVINRLPSKYKWDSLNEIYNEFMKKRLGALSDEKEIFCYIPTDSFLASSFGDYPFFIDLLPKSIFSQKIFFIFEKLFEDIDYKNYPTFRKFLKEKHKEKIRKKIHSLEHSIRNHLIRFFALSTPALIIFGLSYLFLIEQGFSYDYLEGATTEQRIKITEIDTERYTILREADSLRTSYSFELILLPDSVLLNTLLELDPTINPYWVTTTDSLVDLIIELSLEPLYVQADSLTDLYYAEIEAIDDSISFLDKEVIYSTILVAISMIMYFVYLRGLFSISHYYNLRLTFFKNLYKKISPLQNIWQRLYLFRLVFLRWLILLSIFVISSVSLLIIVGLIGILLEF